MNEGRGMTQKRTSFVTLKASSDCVLLLGKSKRGKRVFYNGKQKGFECSFPSLFSCPVCIFLLCQPSAEKRNSFLLACSLPAAVSIFASPSTRQLRRFVFVCIAFVQFDEASCLSTPFSYYLMLEGRTYTCVWSGTSILGTGRARCS